MNKMFVGTMMLAPVVYSVLGLFGFGDNPVQQLVNFLSVTEGVAAITIYTLMAALAVTGLVLMGSSYLEQRRAFINKMKKGNGLDINLQ